MKYGRGSSQQASALRATVKTSASKLLKAANPPDCIIVVSRPGWHRLPELVFVTPAGDAIGAPKSTHVELGAGTKLPSRVSRSGTIEGWQAAVRAAATAENCPHWTLSGAAGFAGVLIDLMKFDTCGLNRERGHLNRQNHRATNCSLRLVFAKAIGRRFAQIDASDRECRRGARAGFQRHDPRT